MRLNGKRVMEIMREKHMAEETVCSRTGLSPKSFQGILNNGFASRDAAERIAEATGGTVGELLLPETGGCVENNIEFLKDSGRATVTFSQGRFKSRKIWPQNARRSARSWQRMRTAACAPIFRLRG